MPLWPKQLREDNYWDLALTNVELWYEKTGIPPLLTSGVWSLANRIVYTPVRVPHSAPFPAFWAPYLWNGAVISGLYFLGVYGDDDGQPGELIFQTRIGAQTTINVWQTPGADLDVAIGNGLYWLAAAFDNTTAEVTRVATLAANGIGQFASIFYEDRATLELPAIATPLLASIALGSVPVMALIGGS